MFKYLLHGIESNLDCHSFQDIISEIKDIPMVSCVIAAIKQISSGKFIFVIW
jgi:hypothetical protein